MKEYRRIQREILAKRRLKTQEYVRRVMKRMDRSARPISVPRARPTDPSRELSAILTED